MIDESHPCYPCKYLKNKPVREFKGEEFLQLVQAEKDGLLNIKISIDIEQSAERRWYRDSHSFICLLIVVF